MEARALVPSVQELGDAPGGIREASLGDSLSLSLGSLGCRFGVLFWYFLGSVSVAVHWEGPKPLSVLGTSYIGMLPES